jgi:hypothetical protein
LEKQTRTKGNEVSDKVIHGKTFTPAPEGTWAAVCVDVWPFFEAETKWGKKTKTRIAWEIEAKMEDGRPFIVSNSYTVSLHEKSQLYKDLRSWRGGKPFTADEIAAFDLERIIGKQCQLVIVHNQDGEDIYANVVAVLKADPSKPLAPSGKYVRKQDREPSQEKTAATAKSGGPVDNLPVEDPIPF